MAPSLKRLAVMGSMAVAIGSLIGCGARESVHPFSSKHVHDVFMRQNLKVTTVFDAASATDREIARLAEDSTPGRILGRQRMLQAEAAAFRFMRTHHISELDVPSGSADGSIWVFVAPDPQTARRLATGERRIDSKEHAQCVKQLAKPGWTGTCGRIDVTQRGNVVAVYPGTTRSSVKQRLGRAVAML